MPECSFISVLYDSSVSGLVVSANGSFSIIVPVGKEPRVRSITEIMMESKADEVCYFGVIKTGDQASHTASVNDVVIPVEQLQDLSYSLIL